MEGVDCLDEPYQPRGAAVIRAELRELAELYLAGDLDWFKASFPRVWPRPMQQLEMFR